MIVVVLRWMIFLHPLLYPKQIQQISQTSVDALTKNGCISMDLVCFAQGALKHRSLQHSSSTTLDDHPELLSIDKVPSFPQNLIGLLYLNFIGMLVFVS